MEDIQNPADIKLLIDAFYKKATSDPLLGPVFENAQVNWEMHLPRMYNFWSTLLIGTMNYSGSPYEVHKDLPIQKPHFDQWAALFVEAVDENFTGEVANQAKQFARTNAYIFEAKKRMG